MCINIWALQSVTWSFKFATTIRSQFIENEVGDAATSSPQLVSIEQRMLSAGLDTICHTSSSDQISDHDASWDRGINWCTRSCYRT